MALPASAATRPGKLRVPEQTMSRIVTTHPPSESATKRELAPRQKFAEWVDWNFYTINGVALLLLANDAFFAIPTVRAIFRGGTAQAIVKLPGRNGTLDIG